MATSEHGEYKRNFDVWSYNCKGLKSSCGTIENILNNMECDIMFLCEHWLTPHEIPVFNERFINNDMWVTLKSSVDPENIMIGRPHGGIGFIAKKVSKIVYRPIAIDSDRICGMQITSGGKLLLTVFGIYLPYYKGTTNQIQLYSETLDILQSSLDTIEPSPVMIVGDMNTSLPQHHQLSRYWHRTHPFNVYSYMLHDFMCNNDFIVANFAFE